MRSLNDPRGAIWTLGCDGGAPICGIAGTSILGGGGGGGIGGLNCEPPGGMTCATAPPATSVHITAQLRIDNRFISDML